jgi:Fe-S-cluster formation regulator IscX/YfhJ
MSIAKTFVTLGDEIDSYGRSGVADLKAKLMPALDAKFADLRKRIVAIDDIDADTLRERITEVVAAQLSDKYETNDETTERLADLDARLGQIDTDNIINIVDDRIAVSGVDIVADLESRVSRIEAALTERDADDTHRDQTIGSLVTAASESTRGAAAIMIRDRLSKVESRLALRDASFDAHARLIEALRNDLNNTRDNVHCIDHKVCDIDQAISDITDVANLFRVANRVGRFVYWSLAYTGYALSIIIVAVLAHWVVVSRAVVL